MHNLYKLLFVLTLVFTQISVFSQNNGSIKGRVFDALTNESLPFVNVIVTGTKMGAVTDQDGNFVINGLPAGFAQLQVSFLGYKPAVSPDVLVTNAKIAYVEISMELSTQNLNEAVVKADQFQKTIESPLSLRNIGLREIESNPGSNRDISKVIQSFAGIGYTPSFRNDIIVRGGGPNESRFFIDEMEIPNINHFATQGASGGPVGILNADFISSVQYYSGAFPADHGNALSGVFEFYQKDGNLERPKFRLTLGASETSISSDGPLGKKTTYLFSARQSYLQFLFSALGLPFLPTFNDFQIKTRTKFDKKNELIVMGIGAIDRFKLNMKIDEPDESQQYILDYLPVSEQWNYTVGAVYKHYHEKGYQTLVLSRNMLHNTSYKHPGNDENQPRIFDYVSQEIENKLRFENTVRSLGLKWVYGLSGEFVKYNNNTYQQIFIQNAVKEIDYYSYLDFFKYGFFAQTSKAFFNEKLSLSAGLRADGNSYSSSMYSPLNQLSPRLSASLQITDKFSVNANTGRYSQVPSYPTLGYRDNTGNLVNKDNDLKYINVTHYIGGLEYNPISGMRMTVEGFYKDYSNYPFSIRDQINLANKGSDFGVVGNEAVVSIGKGRAYGFEFMNQTRLDNGFSLLLSYTYVRSEFKDKKGEYIPSSWDSRHLLTLTTSKSFGTKWVAGLKWRFSGGLPYTPYNLEVSSVKDAWDIQNRAYLDYNQINSQRYGIFHQLDIRVDRKFFFPKWSFMMYVDIQNFYNFQVQSQSDYLRVKDENGNYKTYTDANGVVRYELKQLESLSGTVLPTIGMMIEF